MSCPKNWCPFSDEGPHYSPVRCWFLNFFKQKREKRERKKKKKKLRRRGLRKFLFENTFEISCVGTPHYPQKTMPIQNFFLFLMLVVLQLFERGKGLDPQTPTQREVEQNTKREAIPASILARDAVDELFESPATFSYLEEFDDGSQLYLLSPSQLKSMFWNEISVAEIVHSFGDGDMNTANCGYDLTIEMGQNVSIFYNQWQLQSLGFVPVDTENNQFTEWTETNIFGFPPFQNVSDPDLKTSSSRPFYGAVNMYRGSGGNPQCGPVAAVLSRSYLKNHILAAPVDTGFFYGECGDGQITGEWGGVTMPLCSAWPEPRPLGHPPFIHHLLQPYVSYYNYSQEEIGDTYPNWNLARLLIRLLSRVTYSPQQQQQQLLGEEGIFDDFSNLKTRPAKPLTLNFVENLLGYFEFNPDMPIPFPIGVKMMIGMFELLWGTETGQSLRNWCIERNWPLVWAYNPEMSFFRCGPSGNASGCVYPKSFTQGIDPANVRILDPFVMGSVSTGYNVTIPKKEAFLFENLWKETNVSVLSREEINGEWEGVMIESFFPSLALEPVYYGACASEDCVGVSVVGKNCVCPPEEGS